MTHRIKLLYTIKFKIKSLFQHISSIQVAINEQNYSQVMGFKAILDLNWTTD